MGTHEVIPPASHALKDTDVHEDKAVENIAVEAEMDSANETLTEDSLRREQRVNSVKSLFELRMKPYSISRLMIPLCRMVAMPMVRPALQCDLTKLENEFVNGYRDGSAVFYVSITNEQGEEEIFLDADKESWSPLWHEKNDEFNAFLNATPGLEQLEGSKFFVCDENHRLLAWRSYISKNYSDKKDWHVAIDSIILETKGRIANAMHAMHDINKQTENSFIKTSLVHTLYRVCKYGVLPLDKFVEHLSASEMLHCKQNLRKSWYPMSIEVFTSFIFRYEIAVASDLVGRVYKEETPLDEQIAGGIIDAMQNDSKDKALKLVSKMGKLLAVANPILGSEWLQQIERHWSSNITPEMTLEKL